MAVFVPADVDRMSSTGISFWACAASCQDQKEREVVGLYRGNTPLLISRPWCAPSGAPVLQIANRRLFPLLSSLISVADYHQHEGVWFGEVATDWRAIAALSGMSRNTIGASLQQLMREGFVHFTPGWSTTPSVIRVLPYNAKTGLRLFQVDASWLRAFILQVQPRLALAEAETQGKSVEFSDLVKPRRIIGLAVKVAQAPIMIPTEFHKEPSAGALVETMSKSDEMIERLKDVPGLEDLYALASGGNPIVKPGPMSCVSPDPGLLEKNADWKKESWSQGGVEVKFYDQEPEPQAAEFGVRPSWQIADEDQAVSPEVAAEISPRALGQGSDGLISYSEKNGESDSNGSVDRSEPNGGLFPGAGAPPPPPAAAPPAASAPFLLSSSERQLTPGQVLDIYRARGNRLNDMARKSMTTKEGSCIEWYERLIGIPFCEQDQPWLQQALTITSHACVLRGIRDCARYPDNNPGFLTVQYGMKNVFNYISKSKTLNAKTRAAQTRATKSGMDQDLQKKIRARRQKAAPAVSSGAPIVSPQAPTVSSEAGIVSQTTPAVSPEPSKGAA